MTTLQIIYICVIWVFGFVLPVGGVLWIITDWFHLRRENLELTKENEQFLKERERGYYRL